MIGVHTPEFGFEKNVDNVRRAVRQDMKIEYPVAIDNDYAIWRAFKNQYWPALYFVDASGQVRQHQFGEGEYEQSELAIQRLLAEAGAAGIGRGRSVGRRQRRGSAGRLGQLAITRELMSATSAPTASRRPAVANRIGVASMRPLRAWRSISGRSLASGRWAGRQPSLTAPTAGSCIAFTRATFIS